MKQIKISDNEGSSYVGSLPESWDEVPLHKYAALAAANGFKERATALVSLVGLPEEVVLEDSSVVGHILRACPFLLQGTLPTAEKAIPEFTHQGVRYTHVGDLLRISCAQYEALDTVLRQAEAEQVSPLLLGHELLAVLYVPAGKKQDADTVAAASEAFKTLPVSIGYPALQVFFCNNWKSSQAIRTYLAAKPQAEAALREIEQALSASQESSWSLRRWLSLTWVRRVKRTL